MIEVYALGDALIRVGDREIRPTSPLVFAALLYLCIERGRRISRREFQELLFPDGSERQAAHSLRQLLYKLRLLGVPLVADSDQIAVDAQDVWCDFARGLEALPERHIYAGFLAGYDGWNAPLFRAWLDGFRAQTLTSLLATLQQRLLQAQQEANYSRIHAVAEAIRAIDPLNDVAAVALAEVLAFTGRRGDALAVLDAHASEIGSTTKELFIKGRALSRLTIDKVSMSANPIPLVGRQAELAHLSQHFSRAQGGRPTLSVVWGDAGIGKTRLVRELTRHALLRHALVIWCHCDEKDQRRPLSAFLDVTPQLLACPGALGTQPQFLKLLKGFAQDSKAQAENASPEMLAAMLREAFSDLVASVAADGPLVLVFEDVHWMDEVSRELLRRLPDGIAGPVLLIATQRAEPSVFLSRVTPYTFAVKLEGLSHDDADRLTSHLMGSGNEVAAARQQCLSLAGGNPLFLCILAEHVRWHGNTNFPEHSITEVIRQRFRTLSPNALLLVRGIAVLGRHANAACVSSVTGLADLELLLALQQVGDVGMVHSRDGLLCFHHELVAKAAIDELPAALRDVLYERAATALEVASRDGNDTSLLWACADAWERCGHREQAMNAYRQCARIATALGHPMFACDALERALLLSAEGTRLAVLHEAIAAARNTGDAHRLLTLLGQFRTLRGQHQAAEADHSAYELDELNALRRLGHSIWEHREQLRNCAACTTASAEHRLTAARLYLYAAEQELARADGRAFYAEVATHIPPDDTASSVLQAQQLAMIYHCCFDDVVMAASHANQFLELLRTLGQDRQALPLLNVAYVLYRADLTDHAVDTMERAYALGRHFGLWRVQVEACAFLADVFSTMGDEAASTSWFGKAEEHLRDSNVTAPHTLLSLRIERAIAEQRFDDAREHVDDALRTYPDLSQPYAQRSILGYRLLIDGGSRKAVRCEHDLDALRRVDDAGRCFGQHHHFAFALYNTLLSSGKREEAAERLLAYVDTYRRERHPLPPFLRDAVDGARRLHGFSPNTNAAEKVVGWSS